MRGGYCQPHTYTSCLSHLSCVKPTTPVTPYIPYHHDSHHDNHHNDSHCGTVTKPTIEINDVKVNEKDGTATFTVTLSSVSKDTVSVNFGTVDGSAKAGSDFIAQSGTLTFAPGQTKQTITVKLVNDTIKESSESFSIKLSNVQGATIKDSEGQACITDDDKCAPVNSNPVAASDSIEVAENSVTIIDVRVNDTDSDGDSLIISAVTQGANGTVTIDPVTGNPVYTPKANFYGTDSFTYTISDGKGGTSTATVSIKVNDMNVAPIFGATDLVANISEEGLANGVKDNQGTPEDNSDDTVSTGSFNIIDTDGNTVDVTLSAPVEALSSNGIPVVWFGEGTNTLIAKDTMGKEIITINIDNSGTYRVELKAPVDHDTKGVEDIKSLSIGVKASDGISSSFGTLMVNVEDDAPSIGDLVQSISLPVQDTNLLFMLDMSDSMLDPSGIDGMNRLEATQDAIKTLLNQYDSFGDIKVRIATFGTDAQLQGTQWIDIATAKSYIDGLTTNGWTNYDAGLALGMEGFSDAGKLDLAKNVAYFISDGAPTYSDGDINTLTNTNGTRTLDADEGIQPNEEKIWTDFLKSNDVTAYAIGIGTDLVTGFDSKLAPIGYSGTREEIIQPIAIIDMSQLTQVLLKTAIEPSSGNLLEGTIHGAGAEYGYLKSVSVNGVDYVFNPFFHSITTTATNYSFDMMSDTLGIMSNDGGMFVVNMSSGLYTYQAPAEINSIPFSETIGIVIVDKDGDEISSSVIFNVDKMVEDIFTIATDYTGNELDNYVTGSSAMDTLHGSEGNDFINGNGGTDSIYGDAGDDTLVYQQNAFIIDGGDGIDSLVLSLNTNIDFTTLDNNAIKNIEVIDLGTTGQHTVNLTLQDVIDMSDSLTHEVAILGNSGDTVGLVNETGMTWSKVAGTGADTGFDLYSNSGDLTVMVKIEQNINDLTL